MLKKENQNLSKEKLLAEIDRLKKELKKRKKYGLVWEDNKKEEVVEMCKEKFPVLKEVENKEIITDKNKPVNLLIEGDNYHALSVLNYTHAKKVDVIYIDPPYNTGNKDFIFNDRYVDREDAYRHSKWLSFMEKRLKLAKNLLKDSGVIFISIDDNEMAQLKLLMDHPDLFGENNFVANIIWNKTDTNRKGSQYIKVKHEYILCYLKKRILDKISWSIHKEFSETLSFSNPDNDPRGDWFSANICSDNYISGAKNCFKITSPSGKVWKRKWFKDKEEIIKLVQNNRIYFGRNGNNVPRLKLFKAEWKNLRTFVTGIWSDVGGFTDAKNEYESIMGNEIPFETPKTLKMIKRMITMCVGQKNDVIILDFFAGSGTTAQAVLELNKEDGGNRKFILCTNNENNNGSGYKIAEDICYPRIKKVIEGYKNLKGEKVEGYGGNLKYFKTDFVDYDEPTDRNKIKLTEQATEMLCVKERTFEKVLDQKDFQIFKNSNHYTGIIFDQLAIPEFKKAIKNIKGRFSVYVFSLSDETFDEEFTDIKQKVKLSPIPEAILRVYRRIFR